MELNMNHQGFGIKGKLLLIVGIGVVLLCGQSFFSNKVSSNLIESVDYLGNQRIPLTEAISDIRAATNAAPRFLWLAFAYYSNKNDKQKSIDKIKENLELLKRGIEQAGTYQITEAARAKLSQINEITIKLNEEIKQGIVLLEDGTKEVETKEFLLTKIPPVALKLTSEIRELSDIVANKNKAVITEVQSDAKKAQNLLITCSIIFASILAAFGYIFSSRLSKQLMQITEEVATASSQVASASEQLSRTSESLSSASQEQASAIEETSAAITEITGMVESNVRSAESSNSVANQVHNMSDETRQFMESLSESMTAILESNAKIEKLVKVIEEIGAKTEVIDDIVFKTQLLSFNASVEAERAGEHGRGFAVVAQEVGNLAQMSGKAATEISGIVNGSIKEAESVARDNKTLVEKGGSLAFETKNKMLEVSQKISEILSGTTKIVTASKEQGQGISQISQSVESLNKATQETASTAEESSSASQELASQSETLMDLVNEMRHIVLGTTSKSKEGSNFEKRAKNHINNNMMKKVLPFQKKNNLSKNRNHSTSAVFTNSSIGQKVTDEFASNDVPSHTDEAWENI
jgi:methyl-accepting chemotaxis protein